ncbi:hypothetical protein [Peristeroidobacter soli]|jgi:hypothetical protein|uniref:hypothetical protein n=1 Tax=Peristeroidobacter soli TaxID=2497877 RepID=UPI00101C2AA1|nr:hypothetical protein [Peristeroidobacter soli]
MKYSLLILALAGTGCSTPRAAPPTSETTSATIVCSAHPLPEFTLRSDHLSNEAAVCDCVWSSLSEQDRKVATDLRNGHSDEASIESSFPTRFGQAIGTCTSPGS